MLEHPRTLGPHRRQRGQQLHPLPEINRRAGEIVDGLRREPVGPGFGLSQPKYQEALELFRWLRHRTYTLIKSLPERAWDNSGYHPENGNMTLDDWLDIYERHIPEHVQYMRENYEAWRKIL